MLFFGIIVTIFWFLFIVIVVIISWGTSSVINMSLSEWGDFLAGVSAPMAFLWLILGYHLQRIELKQNTEALKEQKDVLAAQRDEFTQQNQNMQKNTEATIKLTEAVENVGSDIKSEMESQGLAENFRHMTRR